MNYRNVAEPNLSIPPEVLFLLIESPLQSASVYASRCSRSFLFRIMIPSFCVPKRYLPICRNLRRSVSPSVLLTSRTANAVLWSVLQEVSENANASAESSSIFTQSWLIFVTLLTRLHNRCRRFTVVVAETQDVQNVLDVSLTWCNMNGVRVNPRSRRTEVAVL